ncbi:transposase [Streptomyces sp. NPDC045456]|uniref:transposase n=1 Tax=Streptomyces sp. NPDC045456 TaxID=3155254 RepID=UPI0034040559
MAGRRRTYPTDLSGAEWAVLEPLVPQPRLAGRPPRHPRREIINALAYWVRAGCAWRLLPQGSRWGGANHYLRWPDHQPGKPSRSQH